MILDTNALSALADGDRSVEPILQAAAFVAIPVIVLGEYRFGIGNSRHRAAFETWLAEALSAIQILDVDSSTSKVYAELRSELKAKGRPIPENDIWIAALVRQHSMPLLSRDEHFSHVSGIKRLSW